MTGPTSTRWRAYRAGTFAVVVTYLAGLGHLAGGGAFPGPGVLLVAGGLIGVGVAGLAGRRRSGTFVLGLTGAAQVAFHLLFQATEHGGHDMVWSRMVLFHLIAGLATVAVLATGEHAVFRLFAALRRAVLRVLRAVPVTGPALRIRPDAGVVRQPSTAPILALLPRRGPPVRV